MANNGGEPSSSPQPEKWYELRLGSSFKDRPSSKFCTLRYEFKPASIDKNQAGMLHKTKDNRVTVEFNNNQSGRSKLVFEGTSEDYKDNDGVLFFDGESFRLERLHRAVKRLRHVRVPGEFTSAVNNASAVTNAPTIESRSPTLSKNMKSQTINKPINHAMPLEVERIDIGDPDSSVIGSKPLKTTPDIYSTLPNPFSTPPDTKPHELDDNVDILDEGDSSPPKADFFGFDINLPKQIDTDDEIADVDVSDEEGNKGPNAAEALRAQVNAAEEGHQNDHEHDETSSSSGSSGTGSSGSGSGSGSSSSNSDDSDGDSATSGEDIDI